MLFETFPYGEDHVLQTVTVAKTPTPLPDDSYWIILIHGGAWRDPTQTSIEYLKPAATILSKTSSPPPIAALASISYRLTSHPTYPQDPTTTPNNEFRSATHPDHIRDVQAALAFLQEKYKFGERYVLVGHSCGATLAFQSVMGCFRFGFGFPARGTETETKTEEDIPQYRYSPPTAILGVAGIYDLKRLRDSHGDISAYQDFIEAAFGSDEGVWNDVSPASVKGSGGVEGGWEEGRLVVLAYSAGDGLVDSIQWDVMRDALVRWETPSKSGQRQVELLPIEGDHDDAWEQGEELARAITFTLDKLQDMGLCPRPAVPSTAQN